MRAGDQHLTDGFGQHDTRRRSWRGGVRVSELLSFALIGVSLGAAVIFGVHQLGSNADAHTAPDEFVSVSAPIPVLHTKEDPLVSPSRLQTASLRPSIDGLTSVEGMLLQAVARDGKEDMLRAGVDEPVVAALEQAMPPAAAVAPRQRPRSLLSGRLIATPPVWKLEQGWRLARTERARVLAQRRKRQRELICMAKAIYFEARSESLKGQMAVAKVVLNRVRDPRFPNTVCGVVYQGAERRNACQFSFACDGKPDYPTEMRHWAKAKRLAAKALRGQIRMRKLEGVAFYHADYVRPTWASMMRPVVKIGRHIFYSDG